MRTLQEVNHAFAPVNKLDPAQLQRLLKLELAFKEMASEIMDLVPECADKTHSLRLLLDSKMWTSQAVTHAWPKAEEAPPKKVKP